MGITLFETGHMQKLLNW